MPLPFFAVSSDLTTGRIHIHRDGKLWRALRASVALPGILPPVTHHGHLLVDGGVMNNLPVDVMREQAGGAGPIIAAGLAREWSLEEMKERMRAVFVDDNPLSDFTLPLIALVRGKKVSARLREHFD